MNESEKIKIILIALLELTLTDQISINDHVLSSTEKSDIIGVLTMMLGSRLGFIAQDLMDILEDPENTTTHQAINLIGQIAFDSKEYRNGKTRNNN